MTFVKGEPSANPSGRPVATISLIDILKRKLGTVPAGTSNTVAETIVDAYLTDVMEKPEARRDIFSRLHSLPKQDVGLSGTGENGAISIEIKMI